MPGRRRQPGGHTDPGPRSCSARRRGRGGRALPDHCPEPISGRRHDISRGHHRSERGARERARGGRHPDAADDGEREPRLGARRRVERVRPSERIRDPLGSGRHAGEPVATGGCAGRPSVTPGFGCKIVVHAIPDPGRPDRPANRGRRSGVRGGPHRVAPARRRSVPRVTGSLRAGDRKSLPRLQPRAPRRSAAPLRGIRAGALGIHVHPSAGERKSTSDHPLASLRARSSSPGSLVLTTQSTT